MHKNSSQLEKTIHTKWPLCEHTWHTCHAKRYSSHSRLIKVYSNNLIPCSIVNNSLHCFSPTPQKDEKCFCSCIETAGSWNWRGWYVLVFWLVRGLRQNSVSCTKFDVASRKQVLIYAKSFSNLLVLRLSLHARQSSPSYLRDLSLCLPLTGNPGECVSRSR